MKGKAVLRRLRLAAAAAPPPGEGAGALFVTKAALFRLREPVGGRAYSVLRIETRGGLVGYGECGAAAHRATLRKISQETVTPLGLGRDAQRAAEFQDNPLFSTPRNLFAGADNDRAESRALWLTDFRKILAAAENDIRRIRETYKPGEVLTSAQHRIPFMVIIAARMNFFCNQLRNGLPRHHQQIGGCVRCPEPCTPMSFTPRS